MAMRDSRFGQFADPNFGASLATPQPAQGVLPAPEAADTSASSDTSNGANTFGMPGLMGQNRGSNPGSVYLAEGGAIPDDTQDSGNSAPANSDPFAMISAALQTGRKKYGLPAKFFGGQDSGDAAPANDGDADDVPETQSFAEGGEVEGEEPDQGVIPDGSTDQEDQPEQGGATPSGNTQQGAMAYLSGHGGVGPEVAAALEQGVDPQGQMDPSTRKMLAIAQAGDPDKAFQVMQHYRQKFNAYGAFAKAALQGSGGRPPNPAAAADALNKAYDHVPDGTSMRFQPAQGGMQVSVSGGQQQAQPETQSFAEGGSVEDDDFNYETAGSQTPSGSSYDRAAQATAAQDEGPEQRMSNLGGAARGVMDAMTPKRDPNNGTQNFFLSMAQLLGWQSKAGQFDSVLDKGAGTTLSEAAAQMPQPNQESEGSVGPGQVADQSGAAPKPILDQNYQQGVQGDAAARQADFNQQAGPKKTPTDAKQFGAKVGTEGGQEGATLADVLHEIDQAYPTVGMAQQRALARAAARQHWADNRTKIESEQTKGAGALERAKVAGGSREAVANTNKDAKVTAVGMQQEGADTRNTRTNDTRGAIADKSQAGQNARFNARENNLNDRAIITNKPGAIGSPEKMDEARRGMGPAKQVGQPQQQGTQLPPEAVRALSEGKVTTFKNGQRWTLKGGVPQQVQ